MKTLSKREVVRSVVEGKRPPYVPWHFQFTKEPWEMLLAHFGGEEAAERALDNHILELGSAIGFFDDLGRDRARDVFGVVWDRTVDKDIGIVEGCVLPEPSLAGYRFPNPLDPRFFADIPAKLALYPDRFRVFYLGFSLFERAWTLRGMENLLLDFIEHPGFVRELFAAITDYNLAQVRAALRYDIDAVYFGDDWGQQHGLIMGKPHWDRFIKPQLERLYRLVRGAGKLQMIHSCGDVDELFDDLIALGLNCFNPFQPEVMDTGALLRKYRGRARLSWRPLDATHLAARHGRRSPAGIPALARPGRRRRLHLRAGLRRGERRARGKHIRLHRGGAGAKKRVARLDGGNK